LRGLPLTFDASVAFPTISERLWVPPVSKDRIKAKDLDGKKGEVLEGWFKRIHEEDPQTEARGPGPVLAVLLNLNLKIFEAGSAQPEVNKHEVTAKRHGLALYIVQN
jgi:hypothetical protein